MSIVLGTNDLAKYPFLEEAGQYIRETHLILDDFGGSEFTHIIERAKKRIELELIDGKVKMLVSSSISKAGILWNITGSFSKDEFLVSEIKPDIPYIVTLEIKPTVNVIPGNYTLTISARYENSVTISKIVDMTIK